MPEPIKVLFAGESWVSHAIHIKGFDSFETSSYTEGATELIAALRDAGVAVDYQPAHVAANAFPADRDALAATLKGEPVRVAFHFAAQANVRYALENPYAYIDSNITGHLNLLAHLVEHRAARPRQGHSLVDA